MSEFEKFRLLVLRDPALQRTLDAVREVESYLEMTANLARQHGFDLSVADVREAYERARRFWFVRAVG
jgi:hypothetical protein